MSVTEVSTSLISDFSGNDALSIASGTGTNFLSVASAATSIAPSLKATGSDTNIPLLLTGKGTGKVRIGDAADPTKLLTFEGVAATTGTSTTLTFSQTANRVLTLPDTTDTLVGKATTDTLTNKFLVDNSTYLVDNASGDKVFNFELGGSSSSTTTTLATSSTASRVLTLPNMTTALAPVITVETKTDSGT